MNDLQFQILFFEIAIYKSSIQRHSRLRLNDNSFAKKVRNNWRIEEEEWHTSKTNILIKICLELQ